MFPLRALLSLQLLSVAGTTNATFRWCLAVGSCVFPILFCNRNDIDRLPGYTSLSGPLVLFDFVDTVGGTRAPTPGGETVKKNVGNRII